MSNPFKDILNKASGMFASNTNDSAVGVDIGSSAIKIVEIKKQKGKAMLETYGSIALGPYADTEIGKVTNLPPEKIVEALKEVLKQSGVSSTGAAFAIPVQSSLIFNVELPPQLKESEMAAVVPTEARKYIPVPISEVTIDYFVAPKKAASFAEANNPDVPSADTEKTEVLVVALQNDAVSTYKTIVAQSNLEASFLEIEIFSSIRSNFEHELSLVLLIDFGASRTKLSLVEFGMVKTYHTINRGGMDISASIAQTLGVPFAKGEEMKKEFGLLGNAEEKEFANIIKTHTDYIFSETNSVLLGYEKKHNRSVSKIILSGGGALLKGLKEEAAQNLHFEIEMGHPFSKVGAPAFLDKVLQQAGPEFAVAIGLALRKLQ